MKLFQQTKRIVGIILSVVLVFLIIGIKLYARLNEPSGNTFSTISKGLGGGGAPENFALYDGNQKSRVLSSSQAPAPAADSASTGEGYVASNSPAQPQERLVIESDQLSVVVKDPQARMAEIADMAKEMGGFVVSSNSSQDTSYGKEIPRADIAIRVPSQKLDEALARIKKGAVDVPYENRTGEDVTSQYVDLQSQLKAKEAAEKQLLKIMDQATQSKDVLAIYLEVQNVQTQIEQLKGQIKYYKESAAMSLISVTLVAEASTQPIQVGPWKPAGAAKEAIQDLIIFFQNFVDFLIYFILNTLPKLILIVIPLYLVYLAGRAIYRRFNKPRSAAEEKNEEIKG